MTLHTSSCYSEYILPDYPEPFSLINDVQQFLTVISWTGVRIKSHSSGKIQGLQCIGEDFRQTNTSSSLFLFY